MMSDPIEGKASHTFFVYDAQTGDVVHIHQFVPWGAEGLGDTSGLAEQALAQAPSAPGGSAELRVLAIDGDDYSADATYRVDLKTGDLRREDPRDIGSGRNMSPRQLERRAVGLSAG